MIAVVGAGYLGTRAAAGIPGARLVPLDATRPDAVRAMLRSERPRAVINAAGRTGRPNVDWCESHREETYRANVTVPRVLADACGDAGVHLVHVGTGCVFYGPSPHPDGWREDDAPNPVGYYAKTKLEADLALAGMPHVAIARARMLLDGAPHPRNLVTRLAGYAEVADVANSVTVLGDLVAVLGALAEARAQGVFHVTNPGALRHRDLLAAYCVRVEPAHRLTLVDEAALLARGLVQVRRSTCLLADRRLGALGIALRPIDDALGPLLDAYAKARSSAA